MSYKNLFYMGLVPMFFYGCANMGSSGTSSTIKTSHFKNYTSITMMIEKEQLNQSQNKAKEYIYDAGTDAQTAIVNSLLPRQYITAYCSSQNGILKLKYPSKMHLLKDSRDKKLLGTYSSVKQGIGVFECTEKDGKKWMVAIEPVSERKLDAHKNQRVVGLLTKVVSNSDLQGIYTGKAVRESVEKESNTTAKSVASAKSVAPKTSDIAKPEAKPEPEKNKEEDKSVVKESLQQQQQRLYLEARRNIARGQNQLQACGQAERAYNLGRFYNSTGPNIYAESGILVAKCLTTVPSYQKKFANPKGRAKTILQELVNSHNHTVAKHMLKQLK